MMLFYKEMKMFYKDMVLFYEEIKWFYKAMVLFFHLSFEAYPSLGFRKNLRFT